MMRELHGILNLNKSKGWTSREVVDCVERLCRPGKAGHAGTLDPLATGVLVICVGQATRLIQYVQRMRKQYRATFLLGRHSDTDDVEGHVELQIDSPEPTREMIARTLTTFVGRIEQRPPAYSAIRVAGTRAYKLARRGSEIELPHRAVTIHNLQVNRYAYPEIELEIECGSGTYVRALGRDLAAALGTTAVMSALERGSIGRFHVADAVALDELTAETLAGNLQGPLVAVADLPRITLRDDQIAEVCHGRPIDSPLPTSSEPTADKTREWAAVNAAGQLVSILRERYAGQLWPKINFNA
jgi:tRNA pseudouridine55 synthase